MPTDHSVSTSSLSSTYDDDVADGLTVAQAYASSASRRYSFDLVIAVANTRAETDTLNSINSQASTSTVNEPSPHGSARENIAPRSRQSQPVDLESQAGSFEEIELQEWPTSSRLAAMNSAIVAFQSPVTARRQNYQQTEVSYTTGQSSEEAALAAASRKRERTSEGSLWKCLIAVFGL